MARNRALQVGAALVCCVVAAAAPPGCGPEPSRGGGGGPGGAPPDPSDPQLVAVQHAADAVAALDPRAMRLEQALVALDVDRDGDVDAADRAALEACRAGTGEGDCDLTGDGAVDEADSLVFELLVGERRHRSAQAIRDVAEAYRAMAEAELEPSLLELAQGDDRDGDGDTDAADLALFADALERVADEGLDLDGNGGLDLGDVTALARQAALARFGGPAPRVDVDGDGAFSERDVELLGDLAAYTSLSAPGLLDRDGSGTIDASDFCLVAGSTVGAGLAELLVAAPERATLAAAPARLLFCRADGQALEFGRPRADQAHESLVEPEGLWLRPLAEVPAALGIPASDLLPGAALYAVSATPSERRLARLVIPLPTDGPVTGQVLLHVEGPAVEAGAMLLGSGVALPLTDAPPDGQRRAPGLAAGQQQLSAPLHERAVADGHLASRSAFHDELEQLLAEYRRLVAGCPCAEPQRLEFVRRASKTVSCLRASAKAARDASRSMDAGYQAYFRSWLDLNHAAISGWYEYSHTIVDMEIVSTELLLAETLYDTAKGGLAGGLGSALGNLASEVASDHVVPECDGPIGDFARSAGLDQATGPLGAVIEELTGWLTGAARNAGSGLAADAFAEQFQEASRQALAKVGKELKVKALETLGRTLIKAIPKLYTYYVKLRTYAAEEAAQRGFEDFETVRRQRGSLAHGEADLEAAAAAMQEQLDALLARMSADGCSVTLTRDAPCDVDLDLALQAAEARLQASLAEAEALIARSTASSSASWRDSSGERRYEEADLRTRGLALRLRRAVDAGGTQEALETLESELLDSQREQLAARADLAGACLIFAEDVTTSELTGIAEAKDAATLAYDTFEAEVQAALAAYEACVETGGGFGACGLELRLATSDPWSAGASCLGCVPPQLASCCGDGRRQESESCDPAAAPTGCGPGGSCRADCTCEGGIALEEPVSVEDAIGDFLDSISSVTPARVSGSIDFRSYGATTFSLDAADAGAVFGPGGLFPCGASGGAQRVICPAGGAAMPSGAVIRVSSLFDAQVPLADPENSYIYSAVFESDGRAANDWLFHEPYDWDLFRGADRWYQLSWDHQAGSWSATVTQVSDAQATADAPGSTARAVIEGDRIDWFVSASELAAGAGASYRPTSFIHDGRYSQNARGADVGGADPTEALRSFDP